MPLRGQAKQSQDASIGEVRCSFCGKGKDRVRKLVAGPGVYICDECVGLCNEVLAMTPSTEDGGDLEKMLGHLQTAGMNMHQVDKQLRVTVGILRQHQVSWARIGEALGISRQAAWERFSGEE